MSDSLWPRGLQHARLPCPSSSPGVCSNSCPLGKWCHPAISSSVTPFSSCLQSFPASGSFFNESALYIRWPKYWSFSFSIRPSNEYSELISCRIDWFDLLAVQRTLKNLLHHHNSNVPILWGSAFFMVQLSHLYMTTGKTIALTRQTTSSQSNCEKTSDKPKPRNTAQNNWLVLFKSVTVIKDQERLKACHRLQGMWRLNTVLHLESILEQKEGIKKKW